MKKIETFSELSEFVGSVVMVGLAAIQKKYMGKNFYDDCIKLSGFKDLRVVIVGGHDGIRCCARTDKKEGETEIMLLRKTDLFTKGLTSQQWDRVIEKCSMWLEARSLYPKQVRYAIN